MHVHGEKKSIIGHLKSKSFITFVLKGGTKSVSMWCSASPYIFQLM